ncbi:hypothetical protein VCRA2123O443_50013 [Vibrio crassostreae]|nr:hypothetical protein VCRA2110O182_110122 [Vibrio crassostreae]CAK2221770.1 hypothetical protein VCRA2111O408_100014 [Vibrio crassostreae]CAK2321076.1 hypothetical protein VCRA211O406_10989 [Vibrio crassostreae]CAK3426443.1 hypothetical protein VCRA2123O443_50013 [Vibrio crassostreae]
MYTSSKLTELIEGRDRYTFTRIIQPLQCAANIFIKVYLYVYSMVSGTTELNNHPNSQRPAI